ncbi:MAG: hypothetical protein FWC27_10835 [Firmicutes bacterium]|nr:hypothetical protein [Bacillota bacterium]
MSPIRQEVQSFIDAIPDIKLEALRPILSMLAYEAPFIIETDLTDEEKEAIRQGREEYRLGTYVPLHSAI